MHLKLLAAATATNSPPSGATAGYSLNGDQPGQPFGYGWRKANCGVIVVESTAGSGTMTVTLRLWCYSASSGSWVPLGSDATESLRGVLNAKSAIDEDGADTLAHTESVSGLGGFSRIYCEVTAISGTSTAVDVWLEPTGQDS
jgi:hypothetical protein